MISVKINKKSSIFIPVVTAMLGLLKKTMCPSKDMNLDANEWFKNRRNEVPITGPLLCEKAKIKCKKFKSLAIFHRGSSLGLSSITEFAT